MNDTSPAIAERLDRLYLARTPSARVRMATSMFTTAKRLAIAGLGAAGVTGSSRELRMGLLERLYGDEIPLQVRREIAERLDAIDGTG